MVSTLPDQLDARHLGAVTLAVAGLENPRVAAATGGESLSQILEKFVGRLALVNVLSSDAAVVQRAGARLGDQLFNEGPELLRLRLGGLDRTVLDERRREIPHQRELLLTGPSERAPRLAMP